MIRTRIAPSPTGIPHIGNTRTALYNYLFAKKNKGKFIVRIEDTDRERLVSGSLKKILAIFKLLALNWDEGPEKSGPYKPYVQSQRLDLYKKYTQQLINQGDAYYCFCTKERLTKLRSNQQKAKQLPKYDRHCLGLDKKTIENNLKAKKPYVVRLKIPDNQEIEWTDLIQGKIKFNSQNLDDQVLLKSDGYPTYHLAVVIDDYLMKISHVLRGVEWVSSTPKHILLYQAFGWPLPHFGHLPVILGSDKAKLSKRHGAKSALDYQQDGFLPEALVNFMAYLGWSYKDNSDLLTLTELVEAFDLSKIGKANPIFDIKKLLWFNGQWIRKKTDNELAELLKPFLTLSISSEKLFEAIPLIKERLTTLKEVNELLAFLQNDLKININLVKKQADKDADEFKKLLTEIIDIVNNLEDWSVESLEKNIKNCQKNFPFWSNREYFMTLRVAITGFAVTPPLFDSIKILGKTLVQKRLKQVFAKL